MNDKERIDSIETRLNNLTNAESRFYLRDCPVCKAQTLMIKTIIIKTECDYLMRHYKGEVTQTDNVKEHFRCLECMTLFKEVKEHVSQHLEKI